MKKQEKSKKQREHFYCCLRLKDKTAAHGGVKEDTT